MTIRKIQITLRLAVVYNLLWGAFAVLFPTKSFEMFGMQLPLYPQLWQCIGMIVGVYAIGYWLVAQNPSFIGPLF